LVTHDGSQAAALCATAARHGELTTAELLGALLTVSEEVSGGLGNVKDNAMGGLVKTDMAS
jgi:hypothetical protein